VGDGVRQKRKEKDKQALRITIVKESGDSMKEMKY
jgi:hypothetical protein